MSKQDNADYDAASRQAPASVLSQRLEAGPRLRALTGLCPLYLYLSCTGSHYATDTRYKVNTTTTMRTPVVSVFGVYAVLLLFLHTIDCSLMSR